MEIAWSGDLPATGTEWRGLPAVFDGQVIAEYGTGLRAWNLETGQVLWTRSLRTGVALNSRNIVVSNGRAFAAGGDSVYAVDAFTGERLWAFLPDAQAALGDIGVDDVNVYAGTRSHRVYALESGTGHLRWVVDVGATWSNFGIVMGLSSSGDTVYAAATEDLNFSGSLRRGHVVALDRSTGTNCGATSRRAIKATSARRQSSRTACCWGATCMEEASLRSIVLRGSNSGGYGPVESAPTNLPSCGGRSRMLEPTTTRSTRWMFSLVTSAGALTPGPVLRHLRSVAT